MTLADRILQRLALRPRVGMKLAGREARALPRAARPGGGGLLLFGADAMRVALKRAALVEALIGRTARRTCG